MSIRFPVIAITGPRQSGKTTLVRDMFSHYAYSNLEALDERFAAEEDPVRYLRRHARSGLVIDEAQRVPELFSYLQGIVDESGEMGRYILTGSQNFLLLEKITQSLAGRVGLFTLLPFEFEELRPRGLLPGDLDLAMYTGGYPSLYDRGIAPSDYFPSYIQTYIERDVRSITKVGDLRLFQQFVRLCAGRAGQLVNLSSMGNDLGVNYKTVRSWLSILEASFIVFLLSPYHRSFNKRVVKHPKLYFYDTGLLCALLGIDSETQLDTHPLRGAVFESFIISEYLKARFHRGLRSDAYFWRDSFGHEIDLLLDKGGELRAVEIKAGETLHGDAFRGLRYFKSISSEREDHFYLVYGGDRRAERKHGRVLGWRNIAELA